ncbi:sensor histidine kinase [Gloeobacter kilaueensis]|uniref:histidine kinase n=1 Tax=Gloeobacter kilaueensis (strain ATCC BAA-2537 / CCAP 1431/1 / ULC 316 / JS1) TaxID=1183438 RepID=U5QL27_GLOK1|nr:HAMP domain-containing sensor histidine kinase [Gloeobacter kilaueensis]AGY59588.1 histidine kinase [Gloeobacter kilaueensis JS1]
MKVSFSPVSVSSTAPPSPLESACRLHAEQLSALCPILCVRIAYYDPHAGCCRHLTHYGPDQPGLPEESFPEATAENWLTDKLPVATLSEINFKHFHGAAYICPLAYRDPNPEYLLIFSPQVLNTSQKQAIEQATLLLARHLELYQKCVRQHSEIQLLEQVVQRVGHQLRNPLALVSLYAENLCLGLADGTALEQAQIIRETVQELNTNLTELIYCGQGVRLRMSFQDLRSIFDESIEALQPWIAKKGLQVRLPETSLMLVCDRLQLKQVIDNLLNNAVHFSPVGGTINCRWRSFQNEVLIEISDQGPGLSHQDLQQIFTPFYSRRPGGTGLGLAIAKKIVLDHQGSLWAQNLHAGGAQFSLSLPRGVN